MSASPLRSSSHEIKILHVIEDLGRGGAERLLATMLPYLAEQGIANEVMTLGVRDDLAPLLADGGIPVHIGGLSSFRRSLRPVRLVRDRLTDGGFDLVHTHLTYAGLHGRIAARREGIPATSTFHNSDYEPTARAENPEFSLWKQRAVQAADRLTLGPARRVIAVSEFVKRSLTKRLGLSPDRVDVIYNGVPREKVEELTDDARYEARRALGFEAGDRIVVQVGRLTPQKGHRHTFRAAKLLREQGRDIRWLLVGGGTHKAELEEEVRTASLSEHVRFVGSVLDVRPHLRAADVFLFPSLSEGLGIAALEAMAVGLPVVAFDVGPLSEVVVHGETGVLVPAGDSGRLAAAVDGLLREPERARRFGAAGRRRVVELFLVDRAAERHAAFYRDLLNHAR